MDTDGMLEYTHPKPSALLQCKHTVPNKMNDTGRIRVQLMFGQCGDWRAKEIERAREGGKEGENWMVPLVYIDGILNATEASVNVVYISRYWRASLRQQSVNDGLFPVALSV